MIFEYANIKYLLLECPARSTAKIDCAILNKQINQIIKETGQSTLTFRTDIYIE